MASPKKKAANTKKAAPKKTTSKTASTKKATVKKTSTKKAAPKKTTSKAASTKKATVKKTSTKKAAPKKTISKTVSTKKATVKKTSTKKAAPKKTTSKTVSTKKATVKKTSTKKAAPKKTTSKAASTKKATVKKTKLSWKDNSFLYYAYNFIAVSILTVAVRILSALALSQYMGLNWSINYKFKYLPVAAFSERNIQLFEKMNTLSLVITTLCISLFFFLALYKKVKTKQEYNRYVVRSNAWFIGIFISIVTFVASLFMSESIHYATNIIGLIPIIAILLLSCIMYFVKMDKVDKKFSK